MKNIAMFWRKAKEKENVLTTNTLWCMEQKRDPQRNRSFRGPFLRYCFIHQRVNINENQICCSPHIGLTFYKENCMDIITTFGVRGKIEPKNGPQRNGFFGGLLKNDYSCQGTPNP